MKRRGRTITIDVKVQDIYKKREVFWSRYTGTVYNI